jgi:hypothetical protein
MDGMDSDGKRLKIPTNGNVIAVFRAVLLSALIFWIVMPSVPFPVGPGLDGSWVFGLNIGHFDRMNFGRDIIFTYGPLGYLMVPTFPEAEPWVVFAFEWGTALVTAYALWKLCKQAGHWTTAGLYLLVFWVASVCTFDSTPERILAAILAVALVIASRADSKPWFDMGILFFCAAVALLIKFNLGIIAFGVALCMEAWLIWRHRSTMRIVLVPAAASLIAGLVTLVGLYWMSDGTPWGLVAFLRTSLEVARGYSEGMAVAGPMWVAVDALASCFVLWILIPLLASERRRAVWAIPPLFVFGFLCFKSAMVRQDAHALPFQFQIALAALLVVAFAPTPRNRILVGAFAAASLALGILTIAQLWPAYVPSELGRLKGRAALTNLSGYLHWKTTLKTLDSITVQALAPDQLPSDFRPNVTGKRVTAYPWEIASIRANHLQWQPLPVIQAYSAYTPALDRLNAHALEDASGPEEILLAWGAVDAHEPLYETPQSWRALLNWYDLQLTSPKIVLLHRRPTPRFGAAVPFGKVVVAHWDEDITLPPVGDDEGLVMEAEVGQNLKGMVKSALLRAPMITVQVELRSGHTDFRRVLRSNMRSGVIVSDWPRCLSDIEPLFTGGGAFSQDRVVSISFCTPAPSEFRSTIRIHWARIKLLHPAFNTHP